jgi:outer membrane receptor protein involved in Fe transport
MSINQFYDSSLVIYSGEAQHIHETERHSTVVGARFQAGDFRTDNLQTHPIGTDNQTFFAQPPNPAADQSFETPFSRASAYLYHTWEIVEPLRLTAGLSYDYLRYPVNFRAAPISDDVEQTDSWSPKAGLVWTPFTGTTIRTAYTRSLAGASIDQSTQIEPTQVAGFNQSFRSLLPETVAGANAGARLETFGASIEQALSTGTYLAVGADMLSSELDREIGVFAVDFAGYARSHLMANEVSFDERNLFVSVSQLVSRDWSVGVRYHVRDSELDELYPEAVGAPLQLNGFRESQHLEATLHRLHLFTVYNHPSGFFSHLEGLYNLQSNRGYDPDIPGDSFWHLNAFVGYRFPSRKAELQIGVLNLTDQDYQLNPLTLYRELPRERTLAVRLQINL